MTAVQFDIAKYMSERVDGQIKWYSDKSSKAQQRYKCVQIIELALASLIPLLSGFIGQAWWLAVPVGLFGAIIAVLEGVSKIYKFHENWIEYRATSELLKYEKNLFESGSHPYNENEETIENVFVRRVEMIISAENNKWKALNSQDEKADKKG